MLRFLEEKIELAHFYGDAKWTALLGSWLVAAGCLRYRHLQVSEPRRFSSTAFYGHCRRGKQAHLRISGFDFAICSRFSSGWSWAEAWLREWEALTPLAKKRAGMCFNRDGKPWAISEINLGVQEIFSDMLQEPADMTTYSWRRLLPTVGQLLRLSPQEQLALGDWASNNPDGNQMPLHYSSARYTTSLRFKALSLAAAWEVRGFEDWSAVTDTELERIKGAVRSQVDDVIVGGRTTIYQAPVTTEALHRSLALTRTWRLRAAKTRATSAKEQVAQMPATLNGKVLTAFLKNGQSLCARFQLGRCNLAEHDCSGSHHRADEPVNHAAEVCYDKIRPGSLSAAQLPGFANRRRARFSKLSAALFAVDTIASVFSGVLLKGSAQFEAESEGEAEVGCKAPPGGGHRECRARPTCVFAGARCKSQTIRHNIDELAQGPPLACQHVHDASEWEPYALGDSIVYPSHEESECTAPVAFFLAVSVSWWAARQGLAIAKIHRLPPFEATGRKEHWLQIDRDASYAPLAISLGLRPAQIPGAAELPVRALAEDTVVGKGVLPSGCIYVGQGNYQHRLPTSQWRSPWVAGLNCDPAERLTPYAEFILTELWNELDRLCGMTLLCDCPLDVPCEADVLAGLLFDCRRGAVPVLFRQEAIILRFRKLFPAEWFRGFRFPMIEDIINQAPFDSFGRWLVARGDEWEGPLVPIATEKQQRFRQRRADGQQIGASSHRAAIPPLLPFGLTADEHFEQSLELGTRPNLIFAADMHAKHRGSLRAIRQQAVGALKELKRRWESVGARLRTLQPKALREATRYRDLGLTALLIILTSWGDVTYPFGLIQGLPAVGFAPSYGVFPTQQAHVISFEDVLGDWQAHNAVTIRSAAGAPRELVPGDPTVRDHAGLRKHRIIDNAAEGGQSAASSDANKLVLCSPMRPAQHLRATVCLMSEEELGRARDEDAWETGGEDWPNAYRHSPMSSAEARACVVCFWHHEWQQPAFQLYAGLLFGLPLAVTSFNRYSRLVEVLGRRLVSVLVSLYFDDANLGDWASSRGSGQWAFEQLNGMLGTPFAESK
ncbi:unnamed protein product, partial [Symbiodinium sp. CCMP2456]